MTTQPPLRLVARPGDEPLDLRGHPALPALRSLVVLPGARAAGLEALSGAPQLRDLALGGPHHGYHDLAAAAAAPQLASLTLSRADLPDLEPLRRSTTLRRLSLHRVVGLAAAAAARLERLTQLRASESDLGPLAPLAGSRRLRVLDLEGVPLADLAALAAPALTSFTSDAVADDESGLQLLAGRQRMRAVDYPLRAAGVLAGCAHLERLGVHGGAEHDLAALAHLPLTAFRVHHAPSEERAEQLVAQARATWPGLVEVGYRHDWG